MPKRHDLRRVDADFALTGPRQRTLTQHLNAPASNVFRCFEDGPAWKEWLGLDVEWTSPKPFGVGTTRTVRMNGQAIDEVFTAWEDGREMAFCFARAALPASAFAEHYRLEPAGRDACILHWSYAFEWTGPWPSVSGGAFDLFFSRMAQRALPKLARLCTSAGDRFSGV